MAGACWPPAWLQVQQETLSQVNKAESESRNITFSAGFHVHMRHTPVHLAHALTQTHKEINFKNKKDKIHSA